MALGTLDNLQLSEKSFNHSPLTGIRNTAWHISEFAILQTSNQRYFVICDPSRALQ
jgi:hypothetical protein